jgi:membrane-associated protease RseP (regulator of RpoE activity)
VRIVGMNNLDPVEPGDEDVAYSSKPYRWRLLVITAGSMMHMIIAILIMMFVYTSGGRYQETGEVKVFAVTEGSPADLAGIELGDRILRINGTSIDGVDELGSTIGALGVGARATIDIERAGVASTMEVTLVERPSEPGSGIGYFGVGTDSWGREQLGPISGFSHVMGDLWTGMGRTFSGIGTVVNPANQWEQLTNDEADPNKRPTTVVGVTKVAGEIGDRDGFYGVLEVLASINVFVGLFNLLPLLPFDGGHAAIATYERLRSRKGREYRADVEKMWPATVVVVTLLMFLTFTGLYLDLTRPF